MVEKSIEIMDHLKTGIVILDQDEKIIYANKKAEEITGYTADEINNLEEWFEFTYIDKIRRIEAKKLLKIEAEKDNYNVKHKIRRKDGQIRDIEFDIKELADGDTIVNMRDITEEVQKHKRLINKKEQFEQLFSKATVGILLLDSNFHIKKANSRFLEMFGFKEEEIINKNIYGMLHSDKDKDNYNNFVKSLLINGETYGEMQIEDKKGEMRHFSVHVFKIKLADGKIAFYATYNDISERKENEKEMQKVKERLELALEGANLSIWDWCSESGEITYNMSSDNQLGYSEGRGNHTLSSWFGFIHPDDHDKVRKEISRVFDKQIDVFDSEHRMKNADDDWVWVRDIGRVTARNSSGRPRRAVGILLNIDEQKKREEKIEYLSFHDELTGLYNRRYLENEIERLNNSRKYPISVIVGDIDKLKNINDNYGHQTGDEYIKKSADIFTGILREEDIIIRLGGDEFTVLLPETTQKEAEDICDRVKQRYDEINKGDGFPEKLSISLGIHTVENPAEDLNDAIIFADKSMYKKKGRK